MKKTLFCLPVLAFLMVAASCKKDLSPEYPFTITVKNEEDSLRLQNIFVEVYVPSSLNGTLRFTGYSDENGEVHFEYDKDAVFQVRATRGDQNQDPPLYTHIGCGYVRLEPNEEVYKTIYLRPYDSSSDGCFL